jgi:hypothetical protein
VSKNEDPYTALEDMLLRTQEQELDCDQFVALLAPYLDRRIEDAGIRRLIEHHRDLCAECAEELRLLGRALEDHDETTTKV